MSKELEALKQPSELDNDIEELFNGVWSYLVPDKVGEKYFEKLKQHITTLQRENNELKNEVPNSEDFYEAVDRIGNYDLSDNPKYADYISLRFLEEFYLIKEQFRILNNAFNYTSDKSAKLQSKLYRIREEVEVISAYNIYPYKHLTSDIIQYHMEKLKSILGDKE